MGLSVDLQKLGVESRIVEAEQVSLVELIEGADSTENQLEFSEGKREFREDHQNPLVEWNQPVVLDFEFFTTDFEFGVQVELPSISLDQENALNPHSHYQVLGFSLLDLSLQSLFSQLQSLRRVCGLEVNLVTGGFAGDLFTLDFEGPLHLLFHILQLSVYLQP